ncbi:hypothetical protein JKP88DRAFT_254527 [Tribonema minus]|uniref:Uncharacterized protein n=1 Tax=Tribonema minus TaxID=303371 RepID=A0A836CIB9_9STRA|nr:hypothetical protein JKP88DRAFT_254527 [Tribonema minus]
MCSSKQYRHVRNGARDRENADGFGRQKGIETGHSAVKENGHCVCAGAGRAPRLAVEEAQRRLHQELHFPVGVLMSLHDGGAFHLWAGSFDATEVRKEDRITIRLDAGDVVIFHSALVHEGAGYEGDEGDVHMRLHFYTQSASDHLVRHYMPCTPCAHCVQWRQPERKETELCANVTNVRTRGDEMRSLEETAKTREQALTLRSELDRAEKSIVFAEENIWWRRAKVHDLLLQLFNDLDKIGLSAPCAQRCQREEAELCADITNVGTRIDEMHNLEETTKTRGHTLTLRSAELDKAKKSILFAEVNIWWRQAQVHDFLLQLLHELNELGRRSDILAELRKYHEARQGALQSTINALEGDFQYRIVMLRSTFNSMLHDGSLRDVLKHVKLAESIGYTLRGP